MPILEDVKVPGEEGYSPPGGTRGEGWDDYIVSGLNVRLRGASDPELRDFRSGMYLYAFSGTTGANEVYTTVHILHDWKPGTDIYPHVHWGHKIAAPTGDVVWQIDYSIAKGFSQEAFPTPITISAQQTAGTVHYHQIVETSSVIPAASIEVDAVVLMRIYRNSAHGSDTFENDAFLMQVDLHYESDGRRTNEKTSPFTKVD